MEQRDDASEPQRLRQRQMPCWFPPVLVAGLFAALIWTCEANPGFILAVLAMALGLGLVVSLLIGLIDFVAAKRPRLLRFIEWASLLTTLILGVATWVSYEWRWRWVHGYPGNSIELVFSRGGLDVEIDYSHETMHAILHGAPGYTEFGVPFFAFLPILTPMAFILWARRLSGQHPLWNQCYPDGYCQSCGYNLTANISGICPECGKPIPKGRPAPKAEG